jgi:hypothetical protein
VDVATPPPPTRARSRRIAAGIAVVAVVAGVGSGWAFTRKRPEPRPHSVALVGDSITASAQAELTAEGERTGWATAVDATPGAMTPEKQGAADRLAATGPGVAVIHLGTNDSICAYQNRIKPEMCVAGAYTFEDRDRELTRMATRFGESGACVIGVIPYLDLGVGEAWARLRDGGTVQGVADWKTEATAHHAELIADELGHLTGAGRIAYARFVLAAVTATCGTTHDE